MKLNPGVAWCVKIQVVVQVDTRFVSGTALKRLRRNSIRAGKTYAACAARVERALQARVSGKTRFTRR